MISRTLAAAFAATFLLAGAPRASAEPLYTLSFLPAGFQGAHLNDAGQVVGTAGLGADGAAALYSGGLLMTLAPVPSVGRGINNRGDIAGYLGYGFNEAFTHIGGTFTNIDPAVHNDSIESTGDAINDNGVVGGNLYSGGESLRGFLYHGGTVEHIGTFGGDYSPLAAINNNGAATGYAGFAGPVGGGYYHAYLYQNGVLQDLGTLDGIGTGIDSAGNDVNDLGQVVGRSGDRAFLYSGGGMIDLGALGDYGGSATALNDDGLVVGSSYSRLTPGGLGEHAFLYADGAMIDLNTLVDTVDGWELTIARDINAAGQILATACQSGSCASVLLTPVPEPVAGLMLLAGLGVLVGSTRRRVPGTALATLHFQS